MKPLSTKTVTQGLVTAGDALRRAQERALVTELDLLTEIEAAFFAGQPWQAGEWEEFIAASRVAWPLPPTGEHLERLVAGKNGDGVRLSATLLAPVFGVSTRTVQRAVTKAAAAARDRRLTASQRQQIADREAARRVAVERGRAGGGSCEQQVERAGESS